VKLAVNVVHEDAVEVAQAAERLGYEVAFVPEGFRSDAISVLGALAATTRSIDLATGVMQIYARTPAMTAMTVATLDAMSHGRIRLGLGVSNPFICEGWYGIAFEQPLRRMREYVEILRTALRREPVRYDGTHYRLPMPGGRGEPFRQVGAAVRAETPIYLAAVGARSLQLAGEIADGWFGVFCAPETIVAARREIAVGRQRTGRDLTGFEIVPSVPVVLGADPLTAAAAIRAYVARFVSLGNGDENFYFSLMGRMGYADAAEQVQRHQHAGDAAAAAAAVPFEFVDRTAMVGPVERIAERLVAYAEAGVTTLAVSPHSRATAEKISTLEAVADARKLAGLTA
jgi:F420-dependent oxidoreductase-like protein